MNFQQKKRSELGRHGMFPAAPRTLKIGEQCQERGVNTRLARTARYRVESIGGDFKKCFPSRHAGQSLCQKQTVQYQTADLRAGQNRSRRGQIRLEVRCHVSFAALSYA